MPDISDSLCLLGEYGAYSHFQNESDSRGGVVI